MRTMNQIDQLMRLHVSQITFVCGIRGVIRGNYALFVIT